MTAVALLALRLLRTRHSCPVGANLPEAEERPRELPMLHNLGASELRRLAAEYSARANDDKLNDEQRERLRQTYESFLALAASADWLAGRCNPENSTNV